MRDLHLRIITFITLCIGARIFLALTPLLIQAYSSSPLYHARILAIILIAIATGFYIIYFGNLRKTGIETLGKPIWWNTLRPIHATLYLISSTLSWNAQYAYTSLVLATDVIIGFIAFLIHHLA